MTDTEVTRTLTEAVLLRTKMYTLNGTYCEAIAFLEGYYSGIAKTNPYAAPVAEWSSFRQWLAEHRKTPPGADVFGELLRDSNGSAGALEQLNRYLSEFEASRR